VKIWDAETAAEVRTLSGHQGEVYTVAFDADGTLASCSSDATLRLWDPTQGTELHRLTGHKGSVYTVAFSGRQLFSCSADRTAKLWDASTGKELRTSTPHRNEVFAVAATPDGLTWATAGKDPTIRLARSDEWAPTER